GRVQEEGLTPKVLPVPDAVVKDTDRKVLLRSYRAKPDDVIWAQNGIVATFLDGEAVPVVQNIITDAGFNDVVLIPMGADK
ncbi:sulfate transporter, partial [Trifolium medium]|nr:sulfate transporter [Trifolium medium]